MISASELLEALRVENLSDRAEIIPMKDGMYKVTVRGEHWGYLLPGMNDKKFVPNDALSLKLKHNKIPVKAGYNVGRGIDALHRKLLAFVDDTD